MNILLIAPRDEEFCHGLNGFPYGLAYISTVLKENGYNVTCLNLNHVRNVEIDDLVSKVIINNNINIVATGGFSCYYSGIKRILRITSSTKKNIVTIVGGAIITGEPLIMTQALGVDYGVVGEGELTILELIKAICTKNRKISEIKGIVHKAAGSETQYVFSGSRPDPVDVELLPLPDYEGFHFGYCVDTQDCISDPLNVGAPNGVRSAIIFGSRACPFKCTFCFHSTGDKYRQRSIGSIMNEVKYLIEKYQVNYISFADDVLFTNEARATEFCMAISELNIFYCVQVRVTNVTEKILKMLKKSGCICVAYGFESHSQKILDSMKKYVTTAQIDRAVKLTYNAELDIQGNFIFGDPAETPQTARETLDWFDVNKKYHIYVTRIFTAPGAEIYEYAKEKGLIKNVVDFIKNKDYVVNLTSMTAAEYDSFAREIASYAYNPLKRVDYIPQPVLLVHDETEPRYSFTARCEHCNATSTYRNYVRKARLRYDRRYQFVRCLKCHRRYFVDIQQQFAVNKTVIANRLKGNNIYVWGTGDYVEKVYGLFLNNLNISAFIDGWGRIDTYKGHRVIAAKDFIEDPKDCTDLLIAFSKPEIALERIYDFSVPKYNIVPLFESSINSELLDSYESYYNEVPKI